MSKSKLILLIVLAAAIAAYFAFDIGQYLSLDYLKARQSELEAFTHANPVSASALFFAVYVTVTGLSIPGAAVLTLVAGAMFGLLWGTVIVSFASTIGASLAFLAARFLLRDSVQARFGERLTTINRGIETMIAKQVARPKDLLGQENTDTYTEGRSAANIVEGYRYGAKNEKLDGESASNAD